MRPYPPDEGPKVDPEIAEIGGFSPTLFFASSSLSLVYKALAHIFQSISQVSLEIVLAMDAHQFVTKELTIEELSAHNT